MVGILPQKSCKKGVFNWSPFSKLLADFFMSFHGAFFRGIRRRCKTYQVSTSTNTKKAARIDMDDRAKMLQYFAKANDDSACVSIEELFQRSWRLPMAGPRFEFEAKKDNLNLVRVPSVVTIQAPAGIGKSSMLK